MAVLRSDFHDYYDHWFDLSGEKFERFSDSGMERGDMFNFLKKFYEVPMYGTPEDIMGHLRNINNGKVSMKVKANTFVVVYTSTKAHRGEGKQKIPLMEALGRYPNSLCSLHIDTEEGAIKSRTLRYLQIGFKSFWLHFYSSDDWRSNCGNVKIEVLNQQEDGLHPTIKEPLFAVDFVPHSNRLIAVDFNIAPQVMKTGVEDLLSPKDAAESIKMSIEVLKG